MNKPSILLFVAAIAALIATPAAAQSITHPQPDDYNVSWNTPGPGSAASMPLGNGDIGLNAWTDPNGDLLFYISKTDAWGGEKDAAADPWMQQGGVLMKLGLIRISTGAHPLTAGTTFNQTLHLNNAEITIKEGDGPTAVNYRLWVDANHPVIHVEITSPQATNASVTLNDWRLGSGDSIIPSDHTRLTWFHRNPGPNDDRLADSHLANITFGATIEGSGLARKNDSTLSSLTSATTRLISIHPLTATTPDTKDYLQRLGKQTATTDAVNIQKALAAHRQWWHQFWGRSHIYLHDRGDTSPHGQVEDSITQGYILQRFVTACAGRGAYPVKFNGSIFVVDNPAWKSNGHDHPMNADFRAWGGQYWFQNTRPMYWPRLAAGDFDEMMPLFRMYLAMLPGNSALVQKYYGHDGAYFQETAPFWGGLPFMGPAEQALYTHHYFTPILELSMMMLDYYEYTGDETFARTYLMPIATAGLEFFDRHFPRDSAGRLLLDPDNSIEMFWKVHDPAPDIAGLHAVLARMLNLPATLAPDSLTRRWKRLLSVLPPLPIDSSDEPGRLLPYTGPQTAKSHNEENPELYAIYPFRLYGVGRPDLDLARHSFDIRKCPQEGCWSQDPIEAAMLGYTDIVKEDVRFSLTRKDVDLKFPAFWATGHDYKPDEDNGGNGENGLQQMILQFDGKKILLLPAWPSDWDADFKLHAPYRTTIEGKVRNGHLTDLVVTPASRRADIIDCSRPGNNAASRPRHSAGSRFPSYKGLLMAGYQGWFNAPGDGAGRGWNHYHSAGPLEPGNCKFDLWPDVSEYPKTYPSPFTHADGTTADLFSSYDSSTTDLHFKWMKQYGIDGVFMQRFVNSVKNDPGRHHTNVVLQHALDASRSYGRAIAVMYDLSGMKDSVDVDVVINDWKYLVDSLRLTSRGDNQTYLYHHGKPLVAVWGAGFGDHRAYTARSVERILDFLQHDPVYGGCAILLGVPTYWREQGKDADKDPRWMDLFQRVDIIQPWMVGRYNEDTYPPFKELIRNDIAWCKAHGEDYVPVVFPGFSWHNMFPSSPQNQIPRDSGRFFWKQITGDLQAGAQMLYVAMFDEIDEGTAIFKASLNPPVGKSTFLNFDPGIPGDYYLQLAGHAAKMLKQQATFLETPPPPIKNHS
jgi:alpha-L-fucosidase 2